MKWILVMCVLCSAALAEDVCPLEITRVLPDFVSGPSVSGCRDIRMCDAVVVMNHSEKKVVGAKFKMVYLNAVGEPVDNGLEYTGDDGIKSNKEHRYIWRTRFLVSDKSRGAVAWVEKVLYEDGTVWQDDGSKRCLLASKRVQ